MKFFSVLLLLVPCVLADIQAKLFHRIYHPLEQPVKYSLRGSFLLSSSSGLVFKPSDSAPHDLLHFAETVKHIDGAFYQVALERDTDIEEGQWDFSSVKACHLLSHTADHLILHINDAGKPFAIDYFVSPIPHDGSCPTHGNERLSAAAPIFPDFSNTTVSLRTPRFSPQPVLRTPPPLTPEGAIVQPMPEKTFFQKYWMYLLAIGMLILLSGGGPEEEVPRRGSN